MKIQYLSVSYLLLTVSMGRLLSLCLVHGNAVWTHPSRIRILLRLYMLLSHFIFTLRQILKINDEGDDKYGQETSARKTPLESFLSCIWNCSVIPLRRLLWTTLVLVFKVHPESSFNILPQLDISCFFGILCTTHSDVYAAQQYTVTKRVKP